MAVRGEVGRLSRDRLLERFLGRDPVAGFTRNEGSSKAFSALLVGVYHDGRFDFLTPVGTGSTYHYCSCNVRYLISDLRVRGCSKPFGNVTLSVHHSI
jgi:hypothetical protein